VRGAAIPPDGRAAPLEFATSRRDPYNHPVSLTM
jgi:hypothetical protein